MKRIAMVLTGICFALTGFAQTDSTADSKDTIRVGNMIIIKRGDGNSKEKDQDVTITSRRRDRRKSNVTTNWFILDLGVSRFDDKTNYSSAAVQDPISGFAPGSNKDWFKLRNKSLNVNIWLFMQELNVVKHVVNLKYGLGVELNNYHYQYNQNIIYQTQPTKVVLDPSTGYSKNKLAADYLTVPMMLNFNFTPNRRHGFGFSAGMSAGYLYSSRQKTKSQANGKDKVWDDFDLRPWKISYIGELQLGPIKLYGSLANKSMFEKGLDQTPYNVGIRFSN
ncbi:MAG: outer membrane beta-barrel protein [Chitinophagaceae bacterium]|nr:outer membrane beta-barrel protein [Chitinophagaceae bacterium]